MNSSIKNSLHKAKEILSCSLEAEILLAHTLQVSRTYLYSHSEKTISREDQQRFLEFMNGRKSGIPIAYIVGQKEFWSLPLMVSEAVLIPRPETELVVEQLLLKIPKTQAGVQIVDLGTGSGAIALAIAKECPHWRIVATDISSAAINIAKQNAKNLSINNIEFYVGDWFSALDHLNKHQTLFHAVVSNPPYIAGNDPHLSRGDLRFEPINALVSLQDGLKDLSIIIKKSIDYLVPNGCIIVEHGYTQALSVATIMQAHSFNRVTTHKDLANVNRVTVGEKV